MRMRPVPVLCFLAAFALAALIWAQRDTRSTPQTVPWEFQALFPKELGPGRYQHVADHEVQSLCNRGWELVSAAPWVIRNEERGPKDHSVIVTQTYLAYFFKRVQPSWSRDRDPRNPVPDREP